MGHTSATHPHRVSIGMVRTEFFFLKYSQRSNGMSPGHMVIYTPNINHVAATPTYREYNGEPTPTKPKHLYLAAGGTS